MKIIIVPDAKATQLANLFNALAPMKIGKALDHGIPDADVKLFQRLRDAWAIRKVIWLK